MIGFVVAGFAGLLGLAVGSFLNVVAYRVPRGLSVVAPRSACPGCATPIAARDNVPLLSWLLLGGRCRTCDTRISARYPAIEALTAVAFLVAAARFVPAVGEAGTVPAAVAALLAVAAFTYLAAVTVVLSAVDLERKRLPNRIVLPGYVVGAVLLGAASLLTGDLVALGSAALGAAVSFAFYLALALLRSGGMGMGDVKLAGMLGLFLGWLGADALIVGLFSAFLVGGVVGLAMLASGRGGRRTALPFGPFMFLGAWIGILAGFPLAALYLSLTGLN
ncbi:MAG: prepilin peptidase [Naasia sp.]|nr:prepilin peptidase [Naasia sp.]